MPNLIEINVVLVGKYHIALNLAPEAIQIRKNVFLPPEIAATTNNIRISPKFVLNQFT